MAKSEESLKKNLTLALKGLNKARKIKEGKITYDAFPAELWRGVLLSFIDFNSPIP